ncbi:hypothetical protein LLG95_11480 [bacterium]|nr:hypothetical protein [bacterium]
MRLLISIAAVACLLVDAAGAAAPTISGVFVSPVSGTYACVNWTTNMAANSYVDYGATTSYGKTESTPAFVTTHQIQLNGLAVNTTYHYRIRTANASNEWTTSGDYTFKTESDTWGCENQPTGNPMGGGAGYSRIIQRSQATKVVSTAAELKSALSTAKSGNIIYIDDNSMLDMSPQSSTVYIPAGVTLASGRGNNGSPGGMLYNYTFTNSTTSGSPPMLRTNGSGIRITGLRMVGPNNSDARTMQTYHGIYSGHSNVEIDNCEFYGFNYAAIEAIVNAPGPYVHHCYFHNNTRPGVGYGYCPGWGNVAIVEGNIFDRHRHSVAGHGTEGQSYEARYNLVLEHSVSHVFDMHGGYDRGDGTDIAGTTIKIHHNTVRNTDQGAVCVRGKPTDGCWINNNRFYRVHDDWCIRQLYATGNFYESNDIFGLPTSGGSTEPPNPADGTMLGHWPLDEGSGTASADTSGNGHTATLYNTNAASWVAGHAGKAVQFVSTLDDYVDCGTINQLDNFAIDFWFKLNDASTIGQYIITNNVFDFYYRGGTTTNLWFRCRINEAGPGGDVTSWANVTGIKSSTALAAGTWYHVVGTRSGNKMRLFINGTLERELDCLAGFTVKTTNFGALRLGPTMVGVVDEVQYFIPGTPSGSLNGGHAPTLTWTGEANYTNDGLNPDNAAMGSSFTFRVKYTDIDNNPPMQGYPKLHVLRNGVDNESYSPTVMFPADSTTPYRSGRVYTCNYRLPRGSDYSYYFEANDWVGNAAVGEATVAKAGPVVTGGNSIPVIYWAWPATNYVQNIVYPSSGNMGTNFDFRAGYLDHDNDPAQGGGPKLKITNSSSVDIPGSPFLMNVQIADEPCNGTMYQLVRRFPAGTYKYQVIASDSQGVAAMPNPASPASLTVSSSSTNWTDVFTGAPSQLASKTFDVAVWFHTSMTGFTASDVVVTNGTISGFTGSGAFYAFTVTAKNYGTVTVSVPAGVTSPSNAASATLTRTWPAPVVPKNAVRTGWSAYEGIYK